MASSRTLGSRDGQAETELDKGKAVGCCWEFCTTGRSSRQEKESEEDSGVLGTLGREIRTAES